MTLGFNLSAQYSIKGNITDNKGRIIEYAQIYLHGTDYSTESDENGFFKIKNIELGQYLLKVSLIGYNEYDSQVFIDKNIDLNIVLEQKVIKLNDIYINAVRSTDKMPFAYKNIGKEKISEENTGEDVPFLLKSTPSVVTTSDAGAGIGYTGIRIRGTDPTRINVTVNGIPLNDAESQQVYWVDLPDIAGSVESIQIQRGVGSSTNGAGAFGGTINVRTEKTNTVPYLSIDGGMGSFNTKKLSVKAGTGLMNQKYGIDIRYSLINSDGYVDRASSKLNSFFLSATRIFKNSSLKFNAIIGKENTYQAWYGLPVQYKNNDSLRTYNNAGTDYFKKDPAYENQVDDYSQNHFQLFYNKKLNDNMILNLASHYTKGSGFYEQYKVDEDLIEYNLDTNQVKNADLIRRKWLSNKFYGIVYSLKIINDKSNLIIGGAANRYDGDHFGVVDSIVGISGYGRDQGYYKNKGIKNDFNIYAKYVYSLSNKLDAYGDLQYRYVDYSIEGTDDDKRDIDFIDTHSFFNPKLGLKYKILKDFSTYISYSIAQKEPNRVDYLNSPKGVFPKSEKLNDIEFGLTYNTNSIYAGATLYNMSYKDQLILTGKLDDVGNPIRENIENSYRRGIELEFSSKINNFLNIEANSTISKNKIDNYKEYISNWDDYENPLVINHEDTDIAFSPSLIGGVGLSFDLLNILNQNKTGNLYLKAFHKYVGKQYLDNTMNDKTSLDAYNYTNLGLTYKVSIGSFKNIEFSLKINNAFDKKYITNGWVGRIKSDGYNPTSDPYTESEGNGIYHYMGLYPQALRNYMLRIKFDF